MLDRVNACFSAVYNRYFQVEGQTRINHLHSDQYAMFLFFLANTHYKEQVDTHLCEKVFYLNKLLNGIDAFYEVEWPDIFLFSHPLGTVLGRANYSNFFLVYQECTIGAARAAESDRKNIYPVLGEYCAVYKGAAILGNCHVGNNYKISAHSLLIDQDLEANQIYIGTRLNHVVKENRAPNNIWDKDPARSVGGTDWLIGD
ncbi:MAG: serine acetyltransferase [Candidatus Atribacteria bacterium]|nr:serine acetyltransferase [Candidatus Atribacteria bacterium]